jgi:hypothetical protein
VSKKLLEQIKDTLKEKSDPDIKAYDDKLSSTRDALISLMVEHRKFMKGKGIDRGDKQYDKQVIDFISNLEKGEFAITRMQKTIKKL